MNLTCSEVHDLIDLYAAGECDGAQRASVRAHLADCPPCAQMFQEAQQFQGLLDLHFQEPEGLRRLQRRIKAEANPRAGKARILPLLKRVASLAAMLVVVIGLFAWLGPEAGPRDRDDGDRVLAEAGDVGPVLGKGSPPAGWTRTEIGGAGKTLPESRHQRPMMEKAFTIRVDGPAGALVWSAPETRWKRLTGRRVELDAGTLFVTAKLSADKLEVITPAATALARNAAFVIEVRQVPGRAGRKGMCVVSVRVRRGVVALTNLFGRIEASAGENLKAVANKPPKKYGKNP